MEESAIDFVLHEGGRIQHMKLSKQGLLIRWAFFPEYFFHWGDKRWTLPEELKPLDIPANTDLCDVIGRCLFGTPAFVLLFIPFFAVVMTLLFPVGWIMEEFPETRFVKAIGAKWDVSVIRRAVKDWKEKTCTRVEIE